MTNTHIRVWAEEIQPPGILRFTWSIPEDRRDDSEEVVADVQRALKAAEGVLSAELDEDGVRVEIDHEHVTRFDLATIIQTTIDPAGAEADRQPNRIRVWAEDLSVDRLRLTWLDPDVDDDIPPIQRQRRIAASLIVTRGVRSAVPDSDGVLLRYESERLERGNLGDVVRTAIETQSPLRGRADQLLKRAPTYGNLARKLALDDRVSPLPGAAKQAVAARATGGGGRNVAARTAMRFVPGAALITRIQTLIPMLTELSKWSRDADPGIVDEHLSAVGLDRATLRADTITAHEIKLYARDSAFETGAEIGEKASAGARQAISAGRGFLTSVRESMRSESDSTSESESDVNATDTAKNDEQPRRDDR